MRKVAIVGAVQSTEVAARAVIDAPGWTLSALITLPARLAHRHSDFCDLAPLCEQAGAELVPTTQINNADTLDALRLIGPDLILVVGWSQLCGPEFRQIVPGRVLGYHPAPLPRLRGRAAIPWTILSGDPITAGTIMRLEEGADTGAIVAQQFFHVSERETAGSLYAKHMDALAALVAETLAVAARSDGEIGGAVQDEAYATFGARRVAEDGRIDWSQPLADIDRLIRAVGEPYPGAFAMLGDDPLIIWEAVPLAGTSRHLAAPGQLVDIRAGALVVQAIDGLLEITNWKMPAGRSPGMHARLS